MASTTTAVEPKRRGPTKSGLKRHEKILRKALQIASEEGLDNLTIGRLATELGMSKSGLFGHFGSKENLQLEVIFAASEIFIQNIVRHAVKEKSGFKMLESLCHLWFSYVEAEVFSGGCFFLTATHEYKNRPGPIRDSLASVMEEWLNMITRMVAKGQREGSFSPDVDARQIATEINAIAVGTNWEHQLFNRGDAFIRGRKAIERIIRSITTKTETRKFNLTSQHQDKGAQHD